MGQICGSANKKSETAIKSDESANKKVITAIKTMKTANRATKHGLIV
ncbi:hypothetical protein [Gottfriedia acidiceleris]|nr:hypothetical protein [Gottfriedia acidiceleris]